MSFPTSAARGVTQVIDRCESAKTSGFLDLSSCNLLFVADAIYLVLKGYEVTKISIRCNSLKKFPRKLVEKFPNASVCNMEGNRIHEVAEDIGKWQAMKGINMANNKLTELPVGVYEMKSLIILDISGNQIQELDVDRLFSSLSSIVQLNVEGNPLTEKTKKQLNEKKPEQCMLKM